MQGIKLRLLDGDLNVFVASCLPDSRQVIFEWVKHFVQIVKLQKEHRLVVLFDGHLSLRYKDYLNCHCTYKRLSDTILFAHYYLKM